MLELGDVFHLPCNLCDPPKPKYFVVVQVQPLRMLLINSDVNPFVMGKPRHLALHLPLLQAQHEFLRHDSFLACDHLSHEYKHERLLALIQQDPSLRRGRIHDSVKPAIATAFVGNHLIARKYLRDLVPLWESEPGEWAMNTNKHIGSDFDGFLAEHGELEEATAIAIKRVELSDSRAGGNAKESQDNEDKP